MVNFHCSDTFYLTFSDYDASLNTTHFSQAQNCSSLFFHSCTIKILISAMSQYLGVKLLQMCIIS